MTLPDSRFDHFRRFAEGSSAVDGMRGKGITAAAHDAKERAIQAYALNEVIGRINIFIDACKLAAAGASLSLQRVTPSSAPDLRSVLVPWFTRDGVSVVHNSDRVDRLRFPMFHERLPERGDTPLSIGEVADTEHAHPWYEQHRINRDADPKGCFPAYRVADRLLLLDGNHRCISLVRFTADYAIDLVVINGPIDRQIMPDLAVFETA